MAVLAVSLGALLALLSVVCADPPAQLDQAGFEAALAGGQPHFVKFFAPWCGHCKRLAPTWDDLAEKFTGSGVTIAKVDCTVEKSVCADQGVKGYPTLKLFKEGGGDVKYSGSRDLESLAKFVVTETGQQQQEEEEAEAQEAEEEKREVNDDAQVVQVDESGLVHLTDGNFEEYLKKDGIHFVKFFAPWCGHCKRLAPTWDELASTFQEKADVHIIKVDCTVEKTTCQRHGVRGYPTLLLFADGLVVEKYSGSRTIEDLTTFVKDKVLEGEEEEEEEGEEEQEQKGVVELTSDTFTSSIAEGVTFVKFYAPWCGHCKRLAPTWDELAEKVHVSSTTTIAKVDCTTEKDVCQEQGVRSFPTLVLFQDGVKKEEYKGARDLDSLLQFINK